MLSEERMTMSKATRTHLIYQFIIFTLLFLGIGYNELLPDRKFLIFLAFLPIFCYQLVILSCCMELIPVPSFMSFLQRNIGNLNNKDNFGSDTELNTGDFSSLTDTKRIPSLPEVSDISSCHRRWEKSVLNLGACPRYSDYPQRSKSWMNLSDSKSTETLSREGSIDVLSSLCDEMPCLKRDAKARKREERAAKAKSWKLSSGDFDISDENKFTCYKDPPRKPHTGLPSVKSAEIQEESELAKSYSFPIRQKRLETWLEMKETNVADTNRGPCMPYWQTVGYNLAVKYEARRRRRAVPTPKRADVSHDPPQNFNKTIENICGSSCTEKSSANLKKQSKAACACMSKIKVGFSNLISKRKEESPERSATHSSINPNKGSKSAMFKSKNKHLSDQAKKDNPTTMPEFPQFLNNDRPLMFYPKHIPFEKERFESDVKKKMKELAEEQKGTKKVK